MNKVFHIVFGLLGFASLGVFGWYLFNPQDILPKVHIALFFESMLCICLFLLLAPDVTRRQQTKVLWLIFVIVGAAFLLMMTSCKTSEYGCKGKDSWGKTVKRINRPN